MIVYEICPKGLNPVIENKLENLLEYFRESVPGDEWEINVLEMSEEEYNNLPESDGF